MTRVAVDAGICGMYTIIEVIRVAKRKVKVVITSDCKWVTKLEESLIEVDPFDAVKRRAECEIFNIASQCCLHVACAVPVAILKAIEAEAGLALPRDVVIRFEETEQK